MATTTVGRTTIQGATTVGGFNPATLFSAGEQGVWYDPSDLSTLFQDSAGTIPVTALEQPVGRMLDKSGRGNTATQATSANRPVVSARVNLLTYTEAFDNSYWTKNGLVTGGMADVTLAPDGTSTADRFVDSAANDTHIAYRNITGSKADTICFFAKANTRTVATVACNDTSSANWAAAAFNLSAGTAAVAQSGGTFSATSSIAGVGNGWYRCVLTVTSSGNAVGQVKFGVSNSATPTFGSFGDYTYTGDGTSSIYVWGADLRPTNQGVGLPVYQRVGAAVAGASTTVGNADYNANGFPVYLSFDGSNDSLATGSINFSAIDKVSLWSGVRKGASSRGVISTFTSGTWFSSSGSFNLEANTNAGDYNVGLKGSATNDYPAYSCTTFTSPITNIISANLDIAGATFATNVIPKVNGSTPTLTQDGLRINQPTGNFGNYPLYIGARAGTSLFLNGNLYGLIVRGASSTANQITGAENWLNQKTAAY